MRSPTSAFSSSSRAAVTKYARPSIHDPTPTWGVQNSDGGGALFGRPSSSSIPTMLLGPPIHLFNARSGRKRHYIDELQFIAG